MVETVNVAVALVVEPPSVMEVGLSEQLIAAVEDDILQERSMVPLNPPVALAVIVDVPDCPAETVTLVGLAESE